MIACYPSAERIFRNFQIVIVLRDSMKDATKLTAL